MRAKIPIKALKGLVKGLVEALDPLQPKEAELTYDGSYSVDKDQQWHLDGDVEVEVQAVSGAEPGGAVGVGGGVGTEAAGKGQSHLKLRVLFG